MPERRPHAARATAARAARARPHAPSVRPQSTWTVSTSLTRGEPCGRGRGCPLEKTPKKKTPALHASGDAPRCWPWGVGGPARARDRLPRLPTRPASTTATRAESATDPARSAGSVGGDVFPRPSPFPVSSPACPRVAAFSAREPRRRCSLSAPQPRTNTHPSPGHRPVHATAGQEACVRGRPPDAGAGEEGMEVEEGSGRKEKKERHAAAAPAGVENCMRLGRDARPAGGRRRLHRPARHARGQRHLVCASISVCGEIATPACPTVPAPWPGRAQPPKPAAEGAPPLLSHPTTHHLHPHTPTTGRLPGRRPARARRARARPPAPDRRRGRAVLVRRRRRR
jgi:hypothetical protein